MSTMNIGEFARRTGLSISAIRFYGDRGLLEPIDIDRSNGYRTFGAEQVDRARLIAELRRMDMPLVDIEQVLEASDDERNAVVLRHLSRLETAVDRAHAIAQSLGAQPPRQETSMTTNPHHHDTATVRLDAVGLAAAIEQVLPAAGTSPLKPHLMCVLIESKDESVRFVATDGHRLSVRDVPSANASHARAVVAAETLRSWGPSLLEATPVDLANDGRTVTVTGQAIDLSAAVVPVTFPDYDAVLNPSRDRTSTQIVVNRDELLAAFERFDGGDAVLLSTGNDSLVLQRLDDRVEVDARSESTEAHVALDPGYAADALRAAMGVEAVLEIGDELQPVVFRSADDGTYTSLLMPVKLD